MSALPDRRSGSSMVRFAGVRKTYDGLTLVIRDLDLAIRPGEFLTMLGPSGSGKTTTLMMLAGFETATSGEIYLKDQPINHVPPYRRGIGMVFQNYALFPHMTVAENLAFPLQVRGLSRADIRGRVRRMLAMVDLPEMGERKPAQLSGGQQQRVAVARALVFEPDLVLMDEPLGALDKQLREQMQYEIKRIHEQLGVTVVYVTHDQSEALAMSDRIAVFHDGAIQQLSTAEQLYEAPQTAFVAQFIGENNKLRGLVDRVDGDALSVRLPCGTRLDAIAVNPLGAGDRALLSIRPERVRLGPADAQSGCSLAGDVRDVVFLGDHIRIRVAAGGAEDFVVKIPNGVERPAHAIGQRVQLGWRREDCRAFLDAGPAAGPPAAL